MPQHVSHTFQDRRALLRYLTPRYQQASPIQKTLLLDSFVAWTGYSRKYAIELLNHGEQDQQIIQRHRLPQYSPAVQQALFLAWKATHYVCAKRLLPSLPTLVNVLERHGHLQLSEAERRQLLTISVSTAERYLCTQRKPGLHGLSATAPGSLRKDQIPVRVFAPWDEQRPGFVEMDLVMHCGTHLDGRFLCTLTLTDLATGWTECLPLPYKSAETVLAALAQARALFPFPLLGIDTDGGSEFLNEELIGYCERERLTFTRGRSRRKNDQSHIEQKNRSVVREAVGCMRLVGERAYEHLCEVYRALRLVVNYVQPSFKLQAIVPRGDRGHRVYDLAQTPLQRLLASGVLPEERKRELKAWVEQLDPLVLSEQLDILRHTLLCQAQAASEEETEWKEGVVALAHPSGPRAMPTHRLAPTGVLSRELRPINQPERSGEENSWSPEQLREDHVAPPDVATSAARQASLLVNPLSIAVPETPGSATGSEEEHVVGKLALPTLEQAIAAYLQDLQVTERSSKTLQWHRTSLRSLRSSLWRQSHLMGEREFTRASLQIWLAHLSLAPSAQSGKARTISTVAAYARSARAFCNWLVQQGYMAETIFPPDAVPHVPRGLPHPVEPEAFLLLLHACQLSGQPGGRNAGLTARNRAILWLLLDTGLAVSELCALRLADVDRASGKVIVHGKKGNVRMLSLSADGQRAVCAYLDQVRLTPAWEPTVPEAQDRFLLTEQHQPLTKNSLTLLFVRLSQRAGFTRTPICPSMLRDTYAVRFLQAGGTLATLQKQLGIADLVSVKRYEHFCEQQRQV